MLAVIIGAWYITKKMRNQRQKNDVPSSMDLISLETRPCLPTIPRLPPSCSSGPVDGVESSCCAVEPLSNPCLPSIDALPSSCSSGPVNRAEGSCCAVEPEYESPIEMREKLIEEEPRYITGPERIQLP